MRYKIDAAADEILSIVRDLFYETVDSDQIQEALDDIKDVLRKMILEVDLLVK